MSKDFGVYIDILINSYSRHCTSDNLYIKLKESLHMDIGENFGEGKENSGFFTGIGTIRLPYFKMGAIDSVNLFDIDELIIFSFYKKFRNNYRRVADIGANIGLHSIVLGKLGFEVKSYEPDPIHFEKLSQNLKLNEIDTIIVNQKAVSDQNTLVTFNRILGNTTGSHIKGAKDNPYGEIQEIKVEAVDIKEIIEWADLIKMDVEGHEAVLLESIDPISLKIPDILVEVGSQKNAERIYKHFKNSKVNFFSQKTNWSLAKSIEDLPFSYKEGTLFVSLQETMNWN